MTAYSTRLALLVFALLPLSGIEAAEFSSLEERMSHAEYEAAGLGKLSPQELSTLNAWLRRADVAAAVTAPAVATDRTGFLPGSDMPDLIVSKISGTFKGWSGNTTFHLDNGQVWQQAEPSTLAGVSLESPEVQIKAGMISGWYLKVEGYNKQVNVRRIR